MSDGVAMEVSMLTPLDHGAWVHGYWFWLPSMMGEAVIVCVENVEGFSLAVAIQKNLMNATAKNCTSSAKASWREKVA
jgi:hypothetical protein